MPRIYVKKGLSNGPINRCNNVVIFLKRSPGSTQTRKLPLNLIDNTHLILPQPTLLRERSSGTSTNFQHWQRTWIYEINQNIKSSWTWWASSHPPQISWSQLHNIPDASLEPVGDQSKDTRPGKSVRLAPYSKRISHWVRARRIARFHCFFQLPTC